MSLVPGQLVHGRVISRINRELFRVGAAGQVFVAQSDLPLQKGQRLTARVEIGDSKVFLRVFEDDGRGATQIHDLVDREEVRRILIGLGYKPDQTTLTEFQERLERYRNYGFLHGTEPSDVWILALLWTRGIRGGADAYALLSYYLRLAACRDHLLPSPEKMADIILDSDKSAVMTGNKWDSENQLEEELTESAEYIAERRTEAVALLNRNCGEFGIFTHNTDTDSSACRLHFNKKAKDLVRWTDNPTLPMLTLELVRSRGRVHMRIHKLNPEESSQRESLSRWLTAWNSKMLESELEIENMELFDTEDTEYLRFIFWRKWESDQLLDDVA